jgi:predicted DNA-binding transcriptional regulator AlpA
VETKTKPTAEVAAARKAAALKKAAAHKAAASQRLLNKHEVLAIVGISYPTLWNWMRSEKFPRSRVVGGKSMWISTEVDEWLQQLAVRPLKGDAPVEHPSVP